MRYKIGDRVKFKKIVGGTAVNDIRLPKYINSVGTIIRISRSFDKNEVVYVIKFDDGTSNWMFNKDEIAPVLTEKIARLRQACKPVKISLSLSGVT